MKKTRFHFFSSKSSENVWNLGKDDCEIFTKIWAKKIFVTIFSIKGGLASPSIMDVGDCVPYTPYSGFCTQNLDERQLIEIRINQFWWITGQRFWIRSDFWIFDIFMVRFLNNFTSVFFHDSNHFLTFYPLWKRKRILFENFPSPKNFLFSKLIANCLPFNIG